MTWGSNFGWSGGMTNFRKRLVIFFRKHGDWISQPRFAVALWVESNKFCSTGVVIIPREIGMENTNDIWKMPKAPNGYIQMAKSSSCLNSTTIYELITSASQFLTPMKGKLTDSSDSSIRAKFPVPSRYSFSNPVNIPVGQWHGKLWMPKYLATRKICLGV